MRKAIVNVGFLYVKNTGIASTVQESLIKKGIELFDLPLEEKLKIEYVVITPDRAFKTKGAVYVDSPFSPLNFY